MQARRYICKLILSTLFLLFFHNSFAAQTNFQELQNAANGAAKSRIIASFYQDQTGQKLIAGFEVVIGNGWKIYAPDSSGFGVPPSFNLLNSKNINVTKVNPIFPKPYIEQEQIGSRTINYGVYKEKVIIPLEIEAIDPAKDANLQIEVNYSLCKDICIPVAQKFSLTIPSSQSDIQILKVLQPSLENKIITNHSAESSQAQTIKQLKSHFSLIKAIIIAFIGGAILNIMPCVLPVLSIKLLSIINHSQSKPRQIRWAFFSTILGIAFSFLLFATAAVFLKSIGDAFGWGLQFQNPYFLLFLLAVLMVFVANLIGLFRLDVGGSLASSLNTKIIKQAKEDNIFIPNFLSGILAVLLATPCSAPFVGSAISFALSSNRQEIFLIFGSMSLGFALPYMLLIVFPNAVKLMPKPGTWMIRVKQLMVGFLAATAVWLVYILMGNIGFIAAIVAGFLAVLILLFFKIAQKINFIIAKFLFVSLIISIFIVPTCLAKMDKIIEKNQQKNWIKFDENKISDLVTQGKTVVVDITADWCITCKVNKLLVLEASEIKEKLKDANIVAMRGDLTKPDEVIFDFIKKYNRYGIPFNIVFGPSAPNGFLISELLSKEALLQAIEKASK